jgi:hypothetical protein
MASTRNAVKGEGFKDLKKCFAQSPRSSRRDNFWKFLRVRSALRAIFIKS